MHSIKSSTAVSQAAAFRFGGRYTAIAAIFLLVKDVLPTAQTISLLLLTFATPKLVSLILVLSYTTATPPPLDPRSRLMNDKFAPLHKSLSALCEQLFWVNQVSDINAKCRPLSSKSVITELILSTMERALVHAMRKQLLSFTSALSYVSSSL